MSSNVNVFDEKRNVSRYTLMNAKRSLIVQVMDFGATITNILVMDKDGRRRDVVLGFDCFDGYLSKDNPYFGATIGRFANRIGNGSFNLNGVNYKLNCNEMYLNTLHGGIEGFDKKYWSRLSSTSNSLKLTITSENGDEGFPATVTVNVSFTVTEENELVIEYEAFLSNFVNEKLETFINLTNHSYFNLNGCVDVKDDTVLNHEFQFFADKFLETDQHLIPTGKLVSTNEFPFMDFSVKCCLEKKIKEKGNGFDDCYAIASSIDDYAIDGSELKLVSRVFSPSSGITLEYFTTDPGFQFYTPNSMSNITPKSTQSAEKRSLPKFAAFCLESQRFPNSCNKEKWKKQCWLKYNEKYTQKTVYKFEINA